MADSDLSHTTDYADAPATQDAPKTRKCLMCQDAFESAWAGERICKRCKSSQNWKSGI